MTGIGVHFALPPSQGRELLDADGPEEVMAFVAQIEEEAGTTRLDSDKAWDAIDRCLTDAVGEDADEDHPFLLAVPGAAELDAGEDYYVGYLDPEEVTAVAAALAPLDETWFRQRFFVFDTEDYSGARDEADFAYTWSNFVSLRAFYVRAAAEGDAVVFTVEQ